MFAKVKYLLAIGFLFLIPACVTGQATGASTVDIDATVEARLAIIPTPTPQIVIQEVEVIVEKEVPIEVEVIKEVIVEVQVPFVIVVTATPTPKSTATPTATPTPLPTPTATPIPDAMDLQKYLLPSQALAQYIESTKQKDIVKIELGSPAYVLMDLEEEVKFNSSVPTTVPKVTSEGVFVVESNKN